MERKIQIILFSDNKKLHTFAGNINIEIFQMRRYIRKSFTYIKSIILWSRPHLYFSWLRVALFWFANMISLSKWISIQDKKTTFNDFFRLKRKYFKRYQLYEYVINTYGLKDEIIDYIEFGVYKGDSIKWWSEHIEHQKARFFGFDSFEGLPENWGTYQKGDMNSQMPAFNDERIILIKGLFQETLHDFLKNQYDGRYRKVIHLDADLFSSTLFVLTSMAPLIHTGDILFFDEFNVPNHEFLAFKIFTESYYIKTKLLGAVNNYAQVAFIIERIES